MTEAIIVSDVQPQKLNTAAAFHAGDRLIGLKGGERFESMADILEALKRIDGGKDTAVEIERGGRRLQVPIFAGAFHSSRTAEQMLEALGVIGLTEHQHIQIAVSVIVEQSAARAHDLRHIKLARRAREVRE